ncbi:HesA/MoeB/ThiF family protein [Thalassotalea fusca]
MLTHQEKLRYSRQTIVEQIGEDGQLALRDASVLIVGLGGLGNPVSMYLAAAGIGRLFLADGDSVDLSNLQRQVLFSPEDIGQNKAQQVSERLLQNNPDVEIEVIDEMLDDESMAYYVDQVDIVVDCTDNIEARYLMNRACVELQTPLVIGAATGFDGQQIVIDPRETTNACYQCLFPKAEKRPVTNCKTHGIVGPVLPIIAGMQALQTIKLICQIPAQANQLQLYDGLQNQWRSFAVNKQSDCPVCHR